MFWVPQGSLPFPSSTVIADTADFNIFTSAEPFVFRHRCEERPRLLRADPKNEVEADQLHSWGGAGARGL